MREESKMGWDQSLRLLREAEAISGDRKRKKVLDALNPSPIGFPICISSRQTDGPCCPMYSLLSSLEATCSASMSASVIETSVSRDVGTKPYEVGIIAFGVSSPA